MASGRSLRAGKAMIELSLLSGPFEKQLRRIEGRMRTFGATLTRIGTLGIGGGGLQGLQNLFFGSVAAGALAWPVKLAADLELATAEFTTFTGSAEMASGILADLEKFAIRTPYNVSELQKSARTMLMFGVAAKDVVGNVQTIGTVAVGNADRMDRLSVAFGQAAAKGRLMGEEVRQFVNAGFNPLQEIIKVTGETMEEARDRMEDGLIPFSEVQAAFQSATMAGGRFHGLMENIANTFWGQLGIIREAITVAIRPLGEELIPMLTGTLKKISQLVPGFAKIIKENSKIAITVAAMVGVLAVGLTTLTMFGLGIQIIAFAAGGLATALGLVASVGTAMLSPLGAAVTVLAALAVYFFRATTAGKRMAEGLTLYFGRMLEVGKQTFSGIADALKAGELALAGKIAMAGLQVVWLEGTAGIREAWAATKTAVVGATVDMTYEIERLFIRMVDKIKRLWMEARDFGMDSWDVVVAYLAGIGETDAVKEQLQRELVNKVGARGQSRQDDLSNLTRDRNAELGRLDEEQRLAREALIGDLAGQMDEQQQAQADAREELDKLRDAARQAAAAVQDQAVEAEQERLDLAFSDIKKATDAIRSEPIFDTRLAAQMFGEQTDEELAELRRIRRIVERGGGLNVG